MHRRRTLGLVAAALVAASLVDPAPAAAAGTADLSVRVQPDVTTSVGASFFYGVVVSNAGPDEATSVLAVLELPTGLAFPGGDCAPTSTGTRCNIAFGNIPAGFGGASIVQLLADAAGTYTVTATATSPEVDPAPANNVATGIVRVGSPTATVDLSITLPPEVTAYAGSTFSYPVTVRNAGPAGASGVSVVLELPAGLSYASGGCSATPTGSSCTLAFPSLPAGTAVVAMLLLTPEVAGTYEVRATVTSAEVDIASFDNVDTGILRVEAVADLAIDVDDGVATGSRGRPLTYTATVTNLGPSPATDVAVTLAWTSDVRLVVQGSGGTASQGSCTIEGQTVSCDLGLLASGASATVRLSVRPTGLGTVTVRATVRSSGTDPEPANDEDTEVTVIER